MEQKTIKYPELVKTEEGSYFFANGRNQAFFNAEPYEHGVARVQLERGGPWYFRDLDGNLSEDGFSWLISLGNGLYAGEDNKGWRVRDKKGNMSEYFYAVSAYRQDNLLVTVGEEGPYMYLDKNGKYSEQFDYAKSYDKHGVALVQRKDNPFMQYRDIDGNLSEEFEAATHYQDGFARVKTRTGKTFYRDMLGRLSTRPTQSGDAFKEFVFGYIQIDEIPSKFFADSLFGYGIKRAFKHQLEKAIEDGIRHNEPISPSQAKALLLEMEEKIQQKTIEAQEELENKGLKGFMNRVFGKRAIGVKTSDAEEVDEDGAEN